MKRTVLCCALAALPFPLFAAETPIPAVVITAPGITPLPTASSTNSRALQAATSDTASLLRDVPGLSLYGAGGVSSLPAIHGLADDRLRIKIDDMDLIASCPNHMNPALSYLDPSSVGTLQVYAGIAPVSLGGDSIGGTIVASTQIPEFARPGQGALIGGQIGAFYRSNGQASGGNLAASYATEAISIAFSSAMAEAKNYSAAKPFHGIAATGRAGHLLPLDEVGSTAYETKNHGLTLAFKRGDHLFEAKLGIQDMPYQLYPNQRMDMLGNTQERIKLRYLGQFDWGTLEASAYREKVDHLMEFGADKRYWYGTASGGPTAAAGTPCAPVSMSCAAGMPMYTASQTKGAALKANIDLASGSLLRTGLEFQRYELNDWWPPSGSGMFPGVFWNINQGQRNRDAAYAEWELRLNPQWLTLIGARYENLTTNAGEVRGYSTAATAMGNQLIDATTFNASDRARTDHNWDVTALTRYTANNNYDVEVGIAHKVRSPNLYERYTWSTWSMAAVMNNFVGDGNGYIGNLALKPEQANTLSATFDWHADDRSWGVKATPYFTQVSDYIDAVRCVSGSACTAANGSATNQFVILQYANQSARLVGVDLSGHLPLAKNAWGEWRLKGLLNVTRGENRDSGGKLYNIMPLNAKLVLSQQLGPWDNALELIGVQAKDDVSQVRNEIRTAGHVLVNLRTSYVWQNLRLDLGVDNLFDRYYQMPLGGAYTAQGTTMSTNAIPWNVAVPGMGRSVYTGVTLKF